MRVAVFGPPGSGKTTSASRLAVKKHQIEWIEASRDIIERREFDPSSGFLHSHRSARAFFDRATKEIGQDWAARRVLRLAKDCDYVVATGVRGVDNLLALKRNGFFIIYFDASFETCCQRISFRDKVSLSQAATYLQEEDDHFGFDSHKNEADFILSTDLIDEHRSEYVLYNICHTIARKSYRAGLGPMCPACANSSRNKSIFDYGKELCNCCISFRNIETKYQEISLFEEDIRSNKCLVGVSGGKDSSLVIDQAIKMSQNVESFTVDTGYYPITMIDRAKKQSDHLGVPYIVYDARQHISPQIRESFELTARLFDEAIKYETSTFEFLETYYRTRKELYSTKCLSPSAFPRVCVLCRKIVIRSYYQAAINCGAKYILLGMNEWAALSQDIRAPTFSGVRKLQPSPESRPVFVLHVPFMTGATLSNNAKKLEDIGWRCPFGERLVEANVNSCLLAKAAENIFFKNTDFHPDSTRLSREVTVGFMSRGEAIEALRHIHVSPWSVREVLDYAGIT